MQRMRRRRKRYGEIADFMKLGGNTLDEKVELLIAHLRRMNDDLNIPHCIKNYGADSYPDRAGICTGGGILRETAGDCGKCNSGCMHRFQSTTAKSGGDGETA